MTLYQRIRFNSFFQVNILEAQEVVLEVVMVTDLEEDMGGDLVVVMEAAMGVALEVDTQEAADSVEEEVLEAADSAVVVLETTDSRPR